MIADDNGKNPGKKRQAMLNNDFKYIGICIKFIRQIEGLGILVVISVFIMFNTRNSKNSLIKNN